MKVKCSDSEDKYFKVVVQSKFFRSYYFIGWKRSGGETKNLIVQNKEPP